jgi:hypothetical protein
VDACLLHNGILKIINSAIDWLGEHDSGAINIWRDGDTGEIYVDIEWVTWCDEHFADCYFDLEGYDEKGAWEYFKSLHWVSEIIKEDLLQKIEVVPILCRITIFPK